MKPFTRSSKAGFTLVELIIVIAILAILAGVAIPVYSGYIKKANQAADNVLLDALNTAFQAASVEGGQYDGRPASASALLASDGSVSSVKSSADKNGALFAKYFTGNEGKSFKSFTALYYNSTNGTFENAEGSISTTYTIDGISYTVSVDKADLAAYQASTFSEALETEELMNEVNKVSGQVLKNQPKAVNALNSLSDGGVEEFLTSIGYTKTFSEMTDVEKANSLVLLAAAGSKDLDANQLVNTFLETGSTTLGLDGFKIDGMTTDELKEATAAETIPYALMMAYANSEIAKDNPFMKEETIKKADESRLDQLRAEYGDSLDIEVTKKGWKVKYPDQSVADWFNEKSSEMNSLTALQNMESTLMTTEGFRTYMTEQGVQDLSGFLSAMNMINDNVNSMNIESLLANGFNDPTIVTMLESILG